MIEKSGANLFGKFGGNLMRSVMRRAASGSRMPRTVVRNAMNSGRFPGGAFGGGFPRKTGPYAKGMRNLRVGARDAIKGVGQAAAGLGDMAAVTGRGASKLVGRGTQAVRRGAARAEEAGMNAVNQVRRFPGQMQEWAGNYNRGRGFVPEWYRRPMDMAGRVRAGMDNARVGMTMPSVRNAALRKAMPWAAGGAVGYGLSGGSGQEQTPYLPPTTMLPGMPR